MMSENNLICSPEDGSYDYGGLSGSDPSSFRRSSSRSIKRKKFDDEVVDTSNPFKRMLTSRRSSESSQPEHRSASFRKNLSRQLSSKKKPNRMNPQPVPSDFGRWRPTDDLTLVTAVQQTNDINAVHLGVKFSCNFTLREIQERWYALLYDPVISKLAQQAMKQLPSDVIQNIQNGALWSKEEEMLLVEISSTSSPTLQKFEKLLDENGNVFHKSRTAKDVCNHWLLMRHYQLLTDQAARPNETDVCLHDLEARINDDELLMTKDDLLDQELFTMDRRQKKELRRLEKEIPQWVVIVDDLIGNGPTSSEFDPQTLAVLRGRVVRYLMRSKEITFGRSASNVRVDIDFSLEGPTWKISRKQGMIKMTNEGKFILHNQGKRPIFINGNPVISGSVMQLSHNSSLEICGLKFLFLINPELKKLTEGQQEANMKKGRKLDDK